MGSLKLSTRRTVRPPMSKFAAPSMRRSARLSRKLSMSVNATLSMGNNATQSTSKLATPSMNKFVRPSTSRSVRLPSQAMEVVPAQVDLEDLDLVVLEVDMVLLLLQLADRFQDNSARMCQRKPVQPAQDRSRDRTARVFPAASVPLSQNSSARAFQDRCANRLPRSNVTTF